MPAKIKITANNKSIANPKIVRIVDNEAMISLKASANSIHARAKSLRIKRRLGNE